jgi:hypothetical protein
MIQAPAGVDKTYGENARCRVSRRPKIGDIAELTKFIDDQLIKFQKAPKRADLRKKVLFLVSVKHAVDDLGVTVAVQHGYDEKAAIERIRKYLCEYVGKVIEGDELAVVSGISEYARRVRQLRVEQGYRILTGASNDETSGLDLRPDQYLLTAVKPDADAARRWHVANRIRREDSGSQEKLLKYFLENVGKVLTTEELAYVADAREFGRRIRELRTEEGYPIATIFTGRPDLAMGEYVMLSDQRIAEPHDRHIQFEVQKHVYSRDNNTCRLCNWSMADWSENDPRILELHHLKQHAKKGENTSENLIVICNKCHDDVHAERKKIPFTSAE